jgi:hypothetical protein
MENTETSGLTRTPSPTDDGTAEYLRRGEPHFVPIGGVALGIFVLVKCYAAAGYSLTTAAALLTSAPLTVLLGTLTSYDYQLFPLLGLAALSWTLMIWRAAGWSIWCTVAAALSVLALLLSPPANLWLPTAALLLLTGARVAVRKWAAGREHGRLASRIRRRPPTAAGTVTAFFVVAAGVMILSTLTNIWVPVETIAAEDSGSTIVVVGHVLSSDEQWTTIVRAKDRGLMHIRTGRVLSRNLCHINGAQPKGRRPLLSFVTRTPYKSPNTTCRKVVASIPNARLYPGSL